MNAPNIVYIDASVQEFASTKLLLERLPLIPSEVIQDLQWLRYPTDFVEGKQQWLVTRTAHLWLRPVSPPADGTTRMVGDCVINTPYDCSYSPLRVIAAARPMLQIATNLQEMVADLAGRLAKTPHKPLRVRIGATGDALALDDITLASHTLIPFFGLMPNGTLELRTRTDNVSHLLQLPHNGQTIITFFINPRSLITSEERGTASLLARLIAARRCLAAGYRVGFAIDPVIQCTDWQRLYEEMLDELFTHIPPEQCEGIDLASLHYPRGLPELALKQFPGTQIFFGEFVPVRGTYRYFRPIREAISRWFATTLARRRIPMPHAAASA